MTLKMIKIKYSDQILGYANVSRRQKKDNHENNTTFLIRKIPFKIPTPP